MVNFILLFVSRFSEKHHHHLRFHRELFFFLWTAGSCGCFGCSLLFQVVPDEECGEMSDDVIDGGYYQFQATTSVVSAIQENDTKY